MTAFDEPWWSVAQLILWVGTHKPTPAWQATEELECHTWEERKKWSYQAEPHLQAGEFEVKYVQGLDTICEVKASEFPYLQIDCWPEVPRLRWNLEYGGELSQVRIKAADIVKAFPAPEATGAAAPQRFGQRGPETSMPLISDELEQWIAGGSPRLLKELKQWTPDEGTTRSKARIARALAAWNRDNGGKELKPGTIEKELRSRLQTAYDLI